MQFTRVISCVPVDAGIVEVLWEIIGQTLPVAFYSNPGPAAVAATHCDNLPIRFFT